MVVVSRRVLELESVLLFATILLVSSTKSSNDDRLHSNDSGWISEETQCRLYMTPSSIPNAGYGVYTTVDLDVGDWILQHDGPNVAIISLNSIDDDDDDEYTTIEKSSKTCTESKSTIPLNWQHWDDVWWGASGGMSDHMMWESDWVMDFQITFGALPNFHPILCNIDTRQPDIIFDDTLVNRMEDPSAGSFSYYTGKHFFTYKQVQAGQELFLDYGERWLDARGDDYQHVARIKDYIAAAKIIRNNPDIVRYYHDFIVDQNERRCKDSDCEKTKQTQMIPVELEESLEIIMEIFQDVAIKRLERPRIARILPKTKEQLKEVLLTTKSFSTPDLAHAIALKQSVLPRTVEWIRSNGMCLDNIVRKTSTIPGAGNGAFAQRSLKQGELIVPVPLIHLLDKDQFRIQTHHGDDQDKDEMNDPDSQELKQQLFFNYCFGHDETSLLLCPTTNVILINHCSNRDDEFTCHGSSNLNDDGDSKEILGPNAAIRWASSEWCPVTEMSLKMTIEEMSKVRVHRLSSIEVYALRDIAPGEEIFIDYGEQWEVEWKSHIRTWAPPDPDNKTFGTYHSTVLLNESPTVDIRGDLRDESWAIQDNIQTLCLYWDDERKPKRFVQSINDPKWNRGAWRMNNVDNDEMLWRFVDDGSIYVKDDANSNGMYWPCSVLFEEQNIVNPNEDEHSDQVLYTVRIFQSPFESKTRWTKMDVPRILSRYPRESILHVNRPFHSDQHLPNSFRHFIGLPDDMVPENWRNLKSSAPACK